MTAVARLPKPVHSTGRMPSGAVGSRGAALLRMNRAAGGTYRCQRDADREVSGRCVAAGYIVVDRGDADFFMITDAGAAFLDQLMRAH